MDMNTCNILLDYLMLITACIGLYGCSIQSVVKRETLCGLCVIIICFLLVIKGCMI